MILKMRIAKLEIMRIFLTFLMVFMFLWLTAVEARAEVSVWVSDSQVRGRLVSGVGSVDDSGRFQAGIEIQMGEGWHTYWKVPGDSGLPPRFDWEHSENVERVDVLWPVPGRKDEAGFQVFAYNERVLLPLDVYVRTPGQPVIVNVMMHVMVCKDVCIPQELAMSLSLPVGEGARTAQQRLIDFAKRKVPHAGDHQDLKIEQAVTGPDALVLNVYSEGGFKHFDVFAHSAGAGYTFTAKPEVVVDKDEPRRAMVRLKAPDQDNVFKMLSGHEALVVLKTKRLAIEKELTF